MKTVFLKMERNRLSSNTKQKISGISAPWLLIEPWTGHTVSVWLSTTKMMYSRTSGWCSRSQLRWIAASSGFKRHTDFSKTDLKSGTDFEPLIATRTSILDGTWSWRRGQKCRVSERLARERWGLPLYRGLGEREKIPFFIRP